MRIRSTNRLRLLLPLVLALAVTACGGQGGDEPVPVPPAARLPEGPNLLLVTLDTVRADRLGCYGRPQAMTPTIDRLAARGTMLPRVSAPTPVTLPSHATILTGAYPPGHGVRANGVFSLAEDRHTLAEMLSAAGYRTGAFVSAFVLDRRFGLDQGFETYDDRMPERDPLARFGFMAERRADATCDRLIEWLEEGQAAGGGARPFFAWLHLFDPHQDYVPPEPFSAGSESARYDGEIAWSDYQLARVLAVLRRLGLLKDTLVVVTADHGQSLGEHGEDTHGLFVYEAATRVPAVFHLPGAVPAGGLCGEAAHLADLVPTVLDLLGPGEGDGGGAGPGREQVQGRSLLTALRGELAGTEPGSLLYMETWHPRYNYGWSESSALVSDRRKYIEAPIPELYDLSVDPAELDNLLQRDGGRWDAAGEVMAAELRRLTEELGGAGSPPAGGGVADEETRGKLLALGYVTGGSPGPMTGPAPDAKEMVHLEEKLFLGATLTQMERYDEALDIYLEVLDRSPGGHNVQFKTGFLLQLLGRDSEAEEHYRVALEYYPGSEETHYNLGVICLRQERYAEALEWLSRAVNLAPDNALFQLDYGEALFRSGYTDKAMSVFRHAAELDPSLARAHFNLGLAATRQGDAATSETAYRRALELNPEYAEAHHALAACLHALGRDGEAAGHWRRYLELDPRGPYAERAAAGLAGLQ